MSLSARRAWIEITLSWSSRPAAGVALRKESVDRNVINEKPVTDQDGSLSARRAWIEIKRDIPLLVTMETVALRKESVDRNVPG